MLEALAFPPDEVPEERWEHGDDLCDCTFQRIGQWANPYLGKTLLVRLCCMWAELERQYPQHFQHVAGYWDENAKRYVMDPAEWNGESDMPPALWHRQIQTITGKPLDEIRRKAGSPPKGVIRGS